MFLCTYIYSDENKDIGIGTINMRWSIGRDGHRNYKK
jgi:hypothetical protein